MVKKIVALVGMLLITGMSVVKVQAEEKIPHVVVDVKEWKFTMENVDWVEHGDEGLMPDLFTDLKDLVPGDVVSEEIKVSVYGLDQGEKVRVYLQSQNENGDYQKIIDQSVMSVVTADTQITEAMKGGICIGEYTRDTTQDIEVQFRIPTSVGNEISSLIGSIDWVFYVEHYEKEITTKPTPEIKPEIGNEKEEIEPNKIPVKTNDSTNIQIWMLYAILSSILGIALLIRKGNEN